MVAACFAMWRAFRYDLATTPRLLHVSEPDTGPQSHPRHDVSATLAGLVAVRSVDIASCDIHPSTGELTAIEPVDPLNGEHTTHSKVSSVPEK